MMAEESKGTGCESRNKKMKVMVAVDGSEVSMHALGWALDHLFTSTAGLPDTSERLGTLVLVHAQPPAQFMMQPVGPAVYATSSVIESVKKAQEQNSAHVLLKAVQLCKERLVEARTLIVDGDPKDKICQAAEEQNADLLVVGSRGLSMLKRFEPTERSLVSIIREKSESILSICAALFNVWSRISRYSASFAGHSWEVAFLGSVSDYVAHHANCPIVIVKPDKSHHPKHGLPEPGASSA